MVGVSVRVLCCATRGRLASVLQTQTIYRAGLPHGAGLAPGDDDVAMLTSTGSIPALPAAATGQPGSPAAADLKTPTCHQPSPVTTFGSEGIPAWATR